MKKIIFILIAVFIFQTDIIQAQSQIKGVWLSEDKEGKIEIYEAQNDRFYGKIIWLQEPNDENGIPYKDTENPEASLRSTPLIGLLILKDFIYEDDKWSEGTIYDPDSGKTYRCEMWLEENNILKIRGYWGVFYETQTWTKSN